MVAAIFRILDIIYVQVEMNGPSDPNAKFTESPKILTTTIQYSELQSLRRFATW